MSSLSPPRLLPWRSWQEWLSAYTSLEALLGAEAGALLHAPPPPPPPRAPAPAAPLPPALAGLAAACQLRGRAPLAVASTLTLLVLLRDARAPPAAASAALGLALLRLVNGVADGGQTGAFAASVADLARRAGLPRWLVDLRHDLTHGAAPEARVLRLAAGHALAWLLARYWRPQAAALALHLGYQEAPAVAALLQAYRAAAEGALAQAQAQALQRRREAAAAGGGGGGGGGKRARAAAAAAATAAAAAAPALAAAALGGPRLLPFSAALLRDVQQACGGRVQRLLEPGFTLPALLRPALRGGARSGGGGTSPVRVDQQQQQQQQQHPALAALQPHLAQRCAPVLAAVVAGAAPPWQRLAWVATALLAPLVHTPGMLLQPPQLAPPQPDSAPAPAPLLHAFLPLRHAHAHAAFAVWLPLLYAVERALPGAARALLARLVAEKARLAGGGGAGGAGGGSEAAAAAAAEVEAAVAARSAMVEAWLWLLRTRYWASLFEWGLAVVPVLRARRAAGARSGGGGGGGSSGAGAAPAPAPATHVLLHARPAWTRSEAAWAFSPAPEACQLGLARSGGGGGGSSGAGAVALGLGTLHAHFFAASALLGCGSGEGGGGGSGGAARGMAWEELSRTRFYLAALAAPVLPALAAAGAGAGEQEGGRRRGAQAPAAAPAAAAAAAAVDSGNLDLEALERLLEGGSGGAAAAAAAAAGGGGGCGGTGLRLLGRAPRWEM